MDNQYRNEAVTRSLSELGQLLELAEKISGQLRQTRLSSFRQIGVAAVLCFIIATGSLFAIIQLYPKPDLSAITRYALATYGTALIGVYATTVFVSLSYRRYQRTESSIITEIIDMVSSILSSIEPQISRVEYAIIRMRLRRLDLSSQALLSRSIVITPKE